MDLGRAVVQGKNIVQKGMTGGWKDLTIYVSNVYYDWNLLHCFVDLFCHYSYDVPGFEIGPTLGVTCFA